MCLLLALFELTGPEPTAGQAAAVTLSASTASQARGMAQISHSDSGQSAQVKLGCTAQIPLRVSQPLCESSLQSSCLSFLTRKRLFTQPNFPTSLDSIHVGVCHSPTLLPSPDVPWPPNFSGNDLAGIHSPSGCILPLCVSHFVSIPSNDFQDPGPSSCQAAFLALVGEGGGDLTLLQVSRRQAHVWGHSSLSPCADPRDLTVPAQSPHRLFFNVLYNFWPPHFI